MSNKFTKSILERQEKERKAQLASQKNHPAPQAGEGSPAETAPLPTTLQQETEKNMEQAQPREPIQNEVSASSSPAKKTVQKKQPSKSLPDLSDFIIKESGRSAKNKTFYLDAAVIEAVHAAAEAQRITDSKLVNDILKKILQV